MSIVTFWNNDREQAGQTLTAVAVATKMAIERNIKILLISTSINDSTIKNCYWKKENKRNLGFFGANTSILEGENGIEGISKLVSSKKITPSIITDYTKVVLKDRLEVIMGLTNNCYSFHSETEGLKKIEDCYIELIKNANQYYDMVIIDLEKRLKESIKKEIINISDVNILMLSQKMESIQKYNEFKSQKSEFEKYRCIPIIGKYIKQYKYNTKNIARYLQEKKELDLIPFNLLYKEATEDADVIDLFLRLKNIKDKSDENYVFMQYILNITNNIFKKLQDMQMRMR